MYYLEDPLLFLKHQTERLSWMIYLATKISLASTIQSLHFVTEQMAETGNHSFDDQTYFSIQDKCYVPDDGTGLNIPSCISSALRNDGGMKNSRDNDELGNKECLVTVLYFGSSSEFYARTGIQEWSTESKLYSHQDKKQKTEEVHIENNQSEQNISGDTTNSTASQGFRLPPRVTDRIQFHFLDDFYDATENKAIYTPGLDEHNANEGFNNVDESKNLRATNGPELRAIENMINVLYSTNTHCRRSSNDLPKDDSNSVNVKDTNMDNTIIIWNLLSWLHKHESKKIDINSGLVNSNTHSNNIHTESLQKDGELGKNHLKASNQQDKYHLKFWNAQTLDNTFSLLANSLYNKQGTIFMGDDYSYGVGELSTKDLENCERNYDEKQAEWMKTATIGQDMQHGKSSSHEDFEKSSIVSPTLKSETNESDKTHENENLSLVNEEDPKNKYASLFSKKREAREENDPTDLTTKIEYIPIPALKYQQYAKLFDQDDISVEKVIPKTTLGAVLRQWFEISTQI